MSCRRQDRLPQGLYEEFIYRSSYWRQNALDISFGFMRLFAERICRTICPSKEHQVGRLIGNIRLIF